MADVVFPHGKRPPARQWAIKNCLSNCSTTAEDKDGNPVTKYIGFDIDGKPFWFKERDQDNYLPLKEREALKAEGKRSPSKKKTGAKRTKYDTKCEKGQKRNKNGVCYYPAAYDWQKCRDQGIRMADCTRGEGANLQMIKAIPYERKLKDGTVKKGEYFRYVLVSPKKAAKKK